MKKPVSWRMRELAPEDIPAVGELFHQVMGFARPASHNHWKFVENPAGPPLGMLAVDGERIVGQFALWPVQLELGGEVVLGAQSLDTMTHPDYQGQGIFTKLANACMEPAAARGVEALYGFPNENSYPAYVKKLHWDHTGDIPIWVRLLRPSLHPKIPRGLRLAADIGVSLLPRGRSHGFEIRFEAPDDAAMESLIEKSAHRGGCSIHRSLAWMKWRFHPASAMQYEWITVLHRGEVVAAAAWGIDMVGGRGDGKLAELLGVDPDGLEAALKTVIGRAKQRGCPVMTTVTNIQRLSRPLKRAGFLQARRAPLIVRKLTARSLGEDIHDHATWNLMGADLDTY